MSLESLRAARKTVGAKQTLKAMKRNDEAVIRPLTDCAAQTDIIVDSTYTMEELGEACRIKVKAAAVGLLK